jgi:hypothetical protein
LEVEIVYVYCPLRHISWRSMVQSISNLRTISNYV